MTGLPAAFSALALASTASVADSEIADMRAETLVDIGSILPEAPGAGRVIFTGRAPGPDGTVRRGSGCGVHCMDRRRCCRSGSVPLWLAEAMSDRHGGCSRGTFGSSGALV